METATVLHLSDLHFGARGDEAAWKAFIEYVETMRPRPTAALVTGDVVDTPSDRNFKRAKESLLALSHALGGTGDSYAEHVFVCPGNHDRYLMGNRLLPSVLPRSGNYNKFLSKRQVDQPFITYVGSDDNRWKLWVSQVDTSEHAGIFAQGFVNEEELKLIRGLKNKGYDPETPFSLVILMMHHHALPIAELEPTTPEKHIFAFTKPTNPGRILEGLIDGHVDLVLHGHEHRHHKARYALYNSDKGELAVVGAGSATGMHTEKARCVVAKSSFNVIEFRSNRSVWLRVFEGSEGSEPPLWTEDVGARVQLLGSTAIRRNRFLRIRTQEADRAGIPPAERPKQYGEWQRHVTLTQYRDALVSDRRTHWPISNGRLRFPLVNETGLPVLPKAHVYLKNRRKRAIPIKDVQIGRLLGAATRTFGFEASMSPRFAAEVETIETSFKWEDAAMLTQSDMDLLDPDSVAGLRQKKGLEFVAATVPNIPLADLTLTVTFPVGYRPDRSQVSVQFQNTNKANEDFTEDKALGERLQMAGQTLVLAIPFPLIGYRYAIAWKPVGGPGHRAEAKEALVARLLREEVFGSRLAEIAVDTFASTGWSQVTAAVYVPDPTLGNGRIVLKRVGGIAERGLNEGQLAADGHPSEIGLAITSSPRLQGLFRTAWWGERGCYGRDGLGEGEASEAGVLPSEAATLVLPVWPSERHGPPAAIFRIGLRRPANETEVEFAQRLTPESWQRALEKVEFQVLHELVR